MFTSSLTISVPLFPSFVRKGAGEVEAGARPMSPVPLGDAFLPHLASPYKGEEKKTAAFLRLTILSKNY